MRDAAGFGCPAAGNARGGGCGRPMRALDTSPNSRRERTRGRMRTRRKDCPPRRAFPGFPGGCRRLPRRCAGCFRSGDAASCWPLRLSLQRCVALPSLWRKTPCRRRYTVHTERLLFALCLVFRGFAGGCRADAQDVSEAGTLQAVGRCVCRCSAAWRCPHYGGRPLADGAIRFIRSACFLRCALG